MNLNLLYTNDSHRGPGKVVQNLRKGLSKVGVEINSHSENIGCLQHIPEINHLSAEKTVYGPNIFVLPSEMPNLCKNIKKFVVPSVWCKELFRRFSLLDNCEIIVWPVGIDIDIWKPPVSKNKNEKTRVLVYFKNRARHELEALLNMLAPYNIHVMVMSYGHYSDDDLLYRCQNVDCAILLTNTESQGIAYMQILSCDIPCLVFNKDYWEYQGVAAPATSVPYFDQKCGIVTKNIDSIVFEDFLSKIETYEPRKFIVSNFTLEAAAKNYISIFEPNHLKETYETSL